MYSAAVPLGLQFYNVRIRLKHFYDKFGKGLSTTSSFLVSSFGTALMGMISPVFNFLHTNLGFGLGASLLANWSLGGDQGPKLTVTR